MGLFRQLAEDLSTTEDNRVKFFLTNRGFHALLSYRLAHWLWVRRVPLLPMVFTRIIQILYGIDIDWRARIDGGCLIVHGVGVVIGQGAEIGRGVKIYHGVTLGIADGPGRDGFPRVGENCLLGAGAKLLGPINIGKGARIGANAVVLRDIPENAVAVGVPARVIGPE